MKQTILGKPRIISLSCLEKTILGMWWQECHLCSYDLRGNTNCQRFTRKRTFLSLSSADCLVIHRICNFKENGGFGFLERSFRYDVDDAVDELTNHDTNSWNWIRAVYLELKNNNPQNKRSFILYVEAVHIVYDQVFNSPSEDDDDYDDDD